jgi:hypothetical protein
MPSAIIKGPTPMLTEQVQRYYHDRTEWYASRFPSV